MEICFESNYVELTLNYKEEVKKINHGQSRWSYDQDRKIGIMLNRFALVLMN
jgi:hypothetical protein